ncbi:hypothetical protein CAEBREN_09945 [Caenorhabditis brenneri]|uniref:Major sperm protein n=1 Tax=Caenorhabditis brenneri TaxID=135651 RepID=G0MDX7_CAEBE|nr:hypothetical protein CAEBREN_09945 [Caenorhabditis brenneri]
MDEVNRNVLQKEWKRFQNDVEEEFKTTKEEMSTILIDAEPNDVEITSTDRGFWEHEISNLSPIDIVCRVRATNSSLFIVNKNSFRIKSRDKFVLRVSRAPHQIRSHHLKIDVTKFTNAFQPSNLLDYFIGPYSYKTFIIRYHGAPRYWSDALEMNDWAISKELNTKWEEEMKKNSKEKKSSLDTSEISSINENQEAEDETTAPCFAEVNKTNVLIMAMQTTEEVKKDGLDVGSDDESDTNETFEAEKSKAKK